MRLPRPCLECQRIAPPGNSRCAQCSAKVRRKWDQSSEKRRSTRLSTGEGAARRLRYRINKLGYSDCVSCARRFVASNIEVDHIIGLAQGGQDIEENLQPMCKSCHYVKSNKALK